MNIKYIKHIKPGNIKYIKYIKPGNYSQRFDLNLCSYVSFWARCVVCENQAAVDISIHLNFNKNLWQLLGCYYLYHSVRY